MTNPIPSPGDRVVGVKTETSEDWYGFLEAGLAGPAGPEGPAGPVGPEGVPGASTTLYTYQYQSQSAPPPANGFVRTDGATAPTSSVFYVAKLDQNGVDNTMAFMNGQVGDELYIQQTNDATCWARWALNTLPVDNGSYITMRATFETQGPTPLTGNKPSIQFGILRAGVPGPPGPMAQMASQGQWAWRSAPSDGTNLAPAQAACNNDSPPQATMLYMFCQDDSGMDHTAMVESLKIGDSVFVFVTNNPDSWQQWTVIGAPSEINEVWGIPVKSYAGSPAGTEPPDMTDCVFQFRDTASVPLGGNPGDVLTKTGVADGASGWVAPSAVGAASFRFVQMAPATTWTIAHNLGYWPNVTAVDSLKREFFPEVTYQDVNTVVLTLSAAMAGEAYCS